MATKCSVSVNVRARPILLRGREQQDGDGTTCLTVNGNSIVVWDPVEKGKKRVFSFDRAFNSLEEQANDFASQNTLYEDVGLPSLEQALKGYNTTVFAYGQTGSGKTYTMMGHEHASLVVKGRSTPRLSDLPDEVGIIPRFCIDLFERISNMTKVSTGTTSCRVDAVYYEIYNDKVFDLLDNTHTRTYKVREHPKHGPYVEGLQHCEVGSYADISRLLRRGARDRHTAKTYMNEVSSRSHAVLELILITSKFDPNTGDIMDTSSRIALVDLAGSERQRQAHTEGERLKEGACINKGLLSLGNVIEALASNSDRGRKRFVQYRDSTLTWLLREALGGNSKTIMLATVSPSYLNYEETLSTLKYADRAKKIQNSVTVNRDSKKQLIFALKEEIKFLKQEVQTLRANMTLGAPGAADDADDDGVSVSVSVAGGVGKSEIRITRSEPYLIQIDPLPTLDDPILYWIEGEKTCYIGSTDRKGKGNAAEASAEKPMKEADHTITLSKSKGVTDYHCLIIKGLDSVSLLPTGGKPYDGRPIAATPRSAEGTTQAKPPLMVDGLEVTGRETLISGSHVRIGEFEFIFVDPENVSDCVRFHQRCTRLEREKAAMDRQVQVTQKRVQDLLVGSGVDTQTLPTKEEFLAKNVRGREGDQVLVRDKSGGPAVYVWKGDTKDGGWVAADSEQAEIAAASLVDQKRAGVECGRRLTNLLGGNVNFEMLPHESDLPKAGPSAAQKSHPVLVRSDETGLKVVQWDDTLDRWVGVPGPVAEMTVRQLADKEERRIRQDHLEAYKKEIQEHITDLDEAKRKLSASKEAHDKIEEMLNKQLKDQQYREEELLDQLREKDRMLHAHKSTSSADKKALQDKIDSLVQEYEERLNNKEHMLQNLESSYSNAKYEWRKNETLLDAALATKQKTLEGNAKLKDQLQTQTIEAAMSRTDAEQTREERDELKSQLTRLQKDLHEARDLRRESASEELKQVHLILEKKESALQALAEEKEQLDGNLRRLSKHYLALQDELKEQQSRLVEYREQMEAEQETCREETDRALHLQKESDVLRAEKNDLIAKIKAIQNDPKKKELEQKRKAENEALKLRLETLETERKQAEGSRNCAEQAVRSEKQRVADLQQRVKETTKQYQVMKEAYELTNDQARQAKESLAAQREEITALRQELKQIKQSPGYMTGAERSRQDMDLSIQLEMVREENIRLQQKLADARMLYERSTDSGRQLAKEKIETEEALKKMRREHKDAQGQLALMTSRADRFKEMSQKLQSEVLRTHGKQEPDEPPMSGRKTQPYGPQHGFTTPRKTGGGSGRKRSVSNEVKVPSYAKPTGAWIARSDDPDPGTLTTNDSFSMKTSNSASNTKMRGPSPSSKGQTPRKGRVKAGSTISKQRNPSPTPQNHSMTPATPNTPNILSPTTNNRQLKRSISDPKRSFSAGVREPPTKTEEY